MKKLISIALVLLMLAQGFALCETVSTTTGRTIEKANKPLLCQFDNEPGARPQMGIASADVVYETEIYNGGYTRYTAVFNDTIPELVEAVRSARIVHLDIYQDWGGIFACYGFQFAEGTDARAYAGQVVDVLFNGNAGDSGFYRDSSRKAPNNVVFKLAEKYNSVEKDFAEKSPLTFSDTPTIQGDPISEVTIPYQKNYTAAYKWDEANQVFWRFYNGNAHKDGATGEQLAYNNVIVQHADYSWYDNAGNRPVVAMTGRNRCDYFIGGHHFTGYWERNSVGENTRYYDDAGNLVQFARGKTFIQIVKGSVEVKWDMPAVQDMPTAQDVYVGETGMARGSRGDDVQKLQERLVALGYLSGGADGVYGANTENAVKSAQQAFGMEATGVADAAFVERLNQ